MDDRTDFSFDDGDLPAPPEDRPVPAPVIVIEPPSRSAVSRLTPPALILLAAVAISSYQRITPVPIRHLGPSPVPPPAPPPPPAPVAPADRIVVRAESRAAPVEGAGKAGTPLTAPAASTPGTPKETTPADTAAVAPGALPSPFELGPGDGLRPLDPASPPETRPMPHPPSPITDPAPGAGGTAPDQPAGPQSAAPPAEAPGAAGGAGQDGHEVPRDDILDDIRREAAQKDAERKNLEELKARAAVMLFAEALKRVEESRAPFRNELRKVLAELGPRAGPAIEQLCDQHGRETLPEVRGALKTALFRLPPRTSRRSQVELMRTLGVPEPVILDYLANLLDKSRNVRGGPRDSHGVRVLAAQQLLGIPLAAPKPPKLPAGAAPPAGDGSR